MAPTTAKATPKATKVAEGGVVKRGRGAPKGPRRANAKNAMAKMQAYFKEHRAEFKDLAFKDQQKELGKMWKASSENPKNNA